MLYEGSSNTEAVSWLETAVWLVDAWRIRSCESALTGRVVDVAYRGRGYDHVVACAGGTLSSVFDANRWPRGAGLTIQIDPDGCVAYPDDASGSNPN